MEILSYAYIQLVDVASLFHSDQSIYSSKEELLHFFNPPPC